jgi:hypothetical protein
MDGPMTTQPDRESLAQAARLLPCSDHRCGTRDDGTHWASCPAYLIPDVAAALAELRDKLERAEGARDELRAQLTEGAERFSRDCARMIHDLEAERDSLRAEVEMLLPDAHKWRMLMFGTAARAKGEGE